MMLNDLPNVYHDAHGYGHAHEARRTSGGHVVVDVLFSDGIERTITAEYLKCIDHPLANHKHPMAEQEQPNECEHTGINRKTCACLACRLMAEQCNPAKAG